MVKGLFCHYLPIYKDINGIYCSTTLTDEFFSRYFCVADELYVATRVYPINKTYQEAHQEKISLSNVHIIEFPNLSTPLNILTKLAGSKKKMLKAAEAADLIFIRGGIIALLGVDAANKLHKPYLRECAGCAWDEYWNYSFLGKLMAPYMEYRAKKITKEASHVIYVTEKWLQNRYPTNGEFTYASNVMLNTIDEKALTDRIEKLKSFSTKKTVRLGTTGGIGNKAKGQQYVMKAMSALSDLYDFQYELVGGGDASYLTDTAKKFGVSDKVIFKGQLTHEEILNWLDSIDIYIQPSVQEGLPRALIEAMSRACPAIGSTTGGIPELLMDENVFKRGSAKDLVRVIKNTLTQDLTENAKINFNKSKEYSIGLLNERRNVLYCKYLEFVRGNK